MSTGRFVVLKAVWLRIKDLPQVKLCVWVSGFRRLRGSWCPYLQDHPSIRRNHHPARDQEQLTTDRASHPRRLESSAVSTARKFTFQKRLRSLLPDYNRVYRQLTLLMHLVTTTF
jgi:hypothetical protein